MQTEAAPREPFTLGVLFRYKFTIFTVASVVILGGYVRIITQPRLYEATARLAVRFTQEALALSSIERSLVKLPLLEEEVKAYTTQILDPQFINQVLDALPDDAATTAEPDEAELPPELTAAQKFRDQFLRAYYNVRQSIYSVLDAIVFTGGYSITEREQRVMMVLSRLKVEAGVEASHIIKVSYQNPNAVLAEKIVNTIAQEFIKVQKRRVQRKDETEAQRVADAILVELVTNKKQLFEIATAIGSPTLEDGIKLKHMRLETLLQKRTSLNRAQALLGQGVIPYDREIGLDSPNVLAELEQLEMIIGMRLQESLRAHPESPDHWTGLLSKFQKYKDDRKAAALQRDAQVVAALLKDVTEELDTLLRDTRLIDVAPEYARLLLTQASIQTRLTQAESELNTLRTFNKEIADPNVSQNVALLQQAQIPPFPFPQYRVLKLFVILALGLFAGCAAALLRHQMIPKPIRHARPRSEDEVDVPLIILPDDGKKILEKDLELDISFPSEGGETRGREARR